MIAEVLLSMILQLFILIIAYRALLKVAVKYIFVAERRRR
jgi:hypothetical protein